jgi:hypothetical protein
MRVLNILFSGIFFGIAISWLFESVMVGRGPVSAYLAPIAIGGILASAMISVGLSLSARRKAQP